MYTLWQYVKPVFKFFFGSEDTFSLVKEEIFLAGGFLLNRPIVYRHQLPTLLNFLHLIGEGVEIGVRDGAYSEVVLHYSQLSKLRSVDPWKAYNQEDYNDASNVSQERQEQLYAFTRKRLAAFVSRSEILRLISKEAATLFTDSSLDFVYIDANHSYEAVTDDLKLWWPKVKNGGILAGHDYVAGYIQSQGDFGVKQSVDEFVKTHKQSLYTTPEKWPTWYIIKNHSLRYRGDLFRYLWREIFKQYQNTVLWRQTRGIRSRRDT